MTRAVKYYRLEPVYEPDPARGPVIATAAVVFCMVTGEYLDGMGGGGDFLSKSVVGALRMTDKPRVVIADPDAFSRRVSELAMEIVADHIDFTEDPTNFRVNAVSEGIADAVTRVIEERTS